MARTFAVGDIHGDLDALLTLLSRLPALTAEDTLVFLGDYVDRGPRSAEVVALIRALPGQTPAKVVALCGNHEDAWLRVIDHGWPAFIAPAGNGCLAAMQSFAPELDPESAYEQLYTGSFFPAEVVEWMRGLPMWYEDEHAIYVHAGLPQVDGRFQHPSEADQPMALLWTRVRSFFSDYRGKPVIVGHTITNTLPPELSQYTPEDPLDMYWAGGDAYAIDTGAGKGGFLTAIELPSLQVYESR